eukprot:scaffold5373_cov68-Phaeocystis_antarctica.AAC.5
MAAHVGLTGCANESGRRQHPVTSRWPSGHVLCCGLMPHLRQEKWKESSERSGRPTLELKRSSLRHPMGAASLIASSTPLYAPPSITSKSPGPCFAVHVPTTTSPPYMASSLDPLSQSSRSTGYGFLYRPISQWHDAK